MKLARMMFACGLLGMAGGCLVQFDGPKGEKVMMPAPVEEVAPVETERVKAETGVGKEGRGVAEVEGTGRIITASADAYFKFKQKAVFEIQIPHALNLYKATNGNAPKTHEQFMKEIIEFNKIELPELPEGHKYIYDPKAEELQVERPAG